jgi:hypothetical protein
MAYVHTLDGLDYRSSSCLGIHMMLLSRTSQAVINVVDPHWFKAYPDPDQKLSSWKSSFFRASEISINLSRGLIEGRPKLQEKPPNIEREHPALQNIHFFHVFGSFLSTWIRIYAYRDQDSQH